MPGADNRCILLLLIDYHTLALTNISGIQNEQAAYMGFRANFAALFILNYWLREFLLSLISDYFELRCQSISQRQLTLLHYKIFPL